MRVLAREGCNQPLDSHARGLVRTQLVPVGGRNTDESRWRLVALSPSLSPSAPKTTKPRCWSEVPKYRHGDIRTPGTLWRSCLQTRTFSVCDRECGCSHDPAGSGCIRSARGSTGAQLGRTWSPLQAVLDTGC